MSTNQNLLMIARRSLRRPRPRPSSDDDDSSEDDTAGLRHLLRLHRSPNPPEPEPEPEPHVSSHMDALVTSVVTDWTCIATGVPSALSENSVEKLKAQLDGLGTKIPRGASTALARKLLKATPSELTRSSYEGPSPHKRPRIDAEASTCAPPSGSLEVPSTLPLPPSRSQMRNLEGLLESAATRDRPSDVPLSWSETAPSAYFLSQLIPPSFDYFRRCHIFAILAFHRCRIPRCVINEPGKGLIFYYGDMHCRQRPGYKVVPPQQLEPLGLLDAEPMDRNANVDWPAGKVPQEVFELITNSLSREDVKSMRLVNHEFEVKLAQFFRSLVVPFSPELYSFSKNRRGSNGSDETQTAERRSSPVNESDLEMFRTRGWSIRKFAIAFEFHEDMLTLPLADIAQPKWTQTKSFYGAVRWPDTTTVRYDTMRELENTADQTQRMKTAFGLFQSLQELGISLDNGFGWLNGPDQSDRARSEEKPTSIFHSRLEASHGRSMAASLASKFVKSSETVSASDMFHQYVRVLNALGGCEVQHLDVVARYMQMTPMGRLVDLDKNQIKSHVSSFLRYTKVVEPTYHWMTVAGLIKMRESNASEDPRIRGSIPTLLQDPTLERYAAEEQENLRRTQATSRRSVTEAFQYDDFDLAATHDTYMDFRDFYLDRIKNHPLKPVQLTNLQLRLLKETEWAQHAFLTTYVLAVIDNPRPMANVRSLNIAKLPGSQLPIVTRADFWAGLPNVSHVTLMVAPDWREVSHAPSFAHDTHVVQSVLPSLSSERFGRLLARHIAPNRTITSLRLGFVGGGEHAAGMFARNRHVLPAPVLPASHNFAEGDVLLLPHVDSLTLVNCWMPAAALRRFAARMGQHSLAALRLESFSLVAFDGCTQPVAASAYHRLPQLRERYTIRGPTLHPTWQGGKAHTDFLLPRLTDADMIAFRGPITRTLLYRVQQIVTPAQALKRKPLHGTWGAVLSDLMPHTLPPNANTPASDAGLPDSDGGAPSTASAQDQAGSDSEGSASALTRIELDSVGYVQLGYQFLLPEFGAHQGKVEGIMWERREALRHRMMMQTSDIFLGQIIPMYISSESTLLTTAYGLTMGWKEGPERMHNLEDDQLEGGSGRYSGVVEAL